MMYVFAVSRSGDPRDLSIEAVDVAGLHASVDDSEDAEFLVRGRAVEGEKGDGDGEENS